MMASLGKFCPKCEDFKSEESFADDSYRRSGKQIYCRECYSFLTRWGKIQKGIKLWLKEKKLKREVEEYNAKKGMTPEKFWSLKLVNKDKVQGKYHYPYFGKNNTL